MFSRPIVERKYAWIEKALKKAVDENLHKKQKTIKVEYPQIFEKPKIELPKVQSDSIINKEVQLVDDITCDPEDLDPYWII